MKGEVACQQAEEDTEAAQDKNVPQKCRKEKNKEAAAMNIEEENSQFQGENDKINLADEYETGRKGTATIRGDGHLDINDKGNARKKARKAKKQIRRGEQGNTGEREAKKAKMSHQQQ